jgi:excisionase family DNA binding protein
MEDKLITVKEVATMLGVHPITIRRMAWRSELPAILIGQRLYKFKESDILNYIKKNTLEVKKDDNEQQATQ